MTDPIVIELQRLASDGTCSVDELLRKALIVSTKLQISDFTDWIRAELDGYDDKEVPDYRRVPVSLKAINQVNGCHMPIFWDEPDRNDGFHRSPIWLSVGELGALLQSKSEFFQLVLPNDVQRSLHRRSDMPMPMEFYLRVSSNAVYRIIDAVRNTVLNWALRLEQEGILGEGMRFTPEEKAIAMTSQNIHIGGDFQGILGDVAGSTVSQTLNMSVKAGDFSSLTQRLIEAGLAAEDLEPLKEALDADPKPTSPSGFGPRVSVWIGTMMSKAASGAWKVTLETAGKLVPAAIAEYYGLGD